MDFQQYLEGELNSHPLYIPKTGNSSEIFRGISKSEYPKWKGWILLRKHLPLSNLQNVVDEELDILVTIHYYIKYIEKEYQEYQK